MLISIQNPYSGKIALYYNRYDAVTIAAYRQFRCPSSNNTSHHLFPLIEFFRFLETSGYTISLERRISPSDISFVRVICSHDLSRRAITALKNMQSRRFPVYSALLLSEHPLYQKRLFTPAAIDLFSDVFTSMKISFRRTIPILSPYIFSEIPCSQHLQSRHNNQVIDTTLISSNLPNKPGTTYGFRRHMINILSEADTLLFMFYGRGWRLSDYSGNLRLLAKYSVSNLTHHTRLTARATSKYGGEIQDKSLLLSAKSCVSIENSISPIGYMTEKLIEPLVFGSVPIYMGAIGSSEIFQILPASSSRFLQNNDAASLLRSCLEVSEMSLRESRKLAESIRTTINAYLETCHFPTGLWKIAQNISDRLI